VSIDEAVIEVAHVLQAATKAPCPIAFWSEAYSEPTGYGDLFAKALLSAGYSKPRTITTATELDALRRFTVIRSAEGVVYEKQTMWHEAGSRDLVYWPAIALPVMVLQEGWGEE
jgi:hypothetical protein